MEINIFSKTAETKVNYTEINWEKTDIPVYIFLWVFKNLFTIGSWNPYVMLAILKYRL